MATLIAPMTERSPAPRSTSILAGLFVISGVAFSWSSDNLAGAALGLVLVCSGAVKLATLAILVFRNWHPAPVSEVPGASVPLEA